MPLNIDREITLLKQVNPDLGQHIGNALDLITKAVNHLGVNSAINPTGNFDKAPTPQNLTVKTGSDGLIHATIDDTNEIQKGLHYFIEYSTNPSFFGSHVKPLGPSRSLDPLTLPAMDDNGNLQQFHFRAYSQYLGGLPSKPINFGGDVPTPVQPTGTARLTLLPSTGSGTGQNDGQNIGVGFGTDLFRVKAIAKRTSGQ